MTSEAMSRKLLPAGTILNRYRIESIIGVGGFGVTYLALEPVHQSYVAIKEYFPKRFANRQSGNTIVPNRAIEDQRVFKWGLKRFLDEARVLARMDHPNIIKVQRYFEMHGTAYFVMDFCDGKPLDKYVDDGIGVSPRSIFQIYTYLTNALEYVHQNGIIHGDLKPSNVLVRADGTPVLLDFGSARQEMLRIVVGQVSDGYSPPEFYGTPEKIGPWSDIYGLGATFYKLITGVKVPIATDRIKFDSYIPATNSIEEGYSAKFLELLDSSLRLSTSERPQSISALKRSLPDITYFSKRVKLSKDLRGEVDKLNYSSSLTFNWRAAIIIFCLIVIFFGGFAFFNRQGGELQGTNITKVSPIVIEDLPSGDSNTVVTSKNSASLSKGNDALQQSLSYLARVTTSSEISWYSLPKTDLAMRSFELVMSDIHKKFDSAIDRKTFTYNENTNEYLFKDFMLTGIKSLGFIAADAKCNSGSVGPVAGTCSKYGRDLKCQFTELTTKYERICLSSFSMQ